MRSIPGLAAALACIVALSWGCGGKFTVTTTHRSGSITDDYVEEPLSESVQRFEHALEVSNAILQQLQAHDIHAVYAERLDPSIQSTVSETDLASLIHSFDKRFGPLKSFKPMQWGFKVWSQDGKDLVSSTKIAEHERGMVRYHFLFEDDGKYEKLLGFWMYPRKGVAAPGPP